MKGMWNVVIAKEGQEFANLAMHVPKVKPSSDAQIVVCREKIRHACVRTVDHMMRHPECAESIWNSI